MTKKQQYEMKSRERTTPQKQIDEQKAYFLLHQKQKAPPASHRPHLIRQTATEPPPPPLASPTKDRPRTRSPSIQP